MDEPPKRPHGIGWYAALIMLALVLGAVWMETRTIADDSLVRPSYDKELLWNPTQKDWDQISKPLAFVFLQIHADDALSGTSPRNFVDDDSLKNLAKFGNLRTLLINSRCITDRGLSHVSKLPKLEAIVFYNCEITDDGVQVLAKLPRLETIGFFETRVTAKGAERLAGQKKGLLAEVWAAKYEKVFDPNGCLRPYFSRKHIDFRVSEQK